MCPMTVNMPSRVRFVPAPRRSCARAWHLMPKAHLHLRGCILEPVTSETTAGGESGTSPPQGWACGHREPVYKVVRLANHPELTVCIGCAHSLSKWAWELEDRDKTSPAARARAAFRSLRKSVVRRGWHHNRFVGRFVRWLGKHTP